MTTPTTKAAELPQALRLAQEFEQDGWIAGTKQWCAEVSAELRRQHVLLDEQQLTIAALNSCIGCETTTENLTAVGRLEVRIADLEAQLEAIGAGGVNGLLMGQPQAMPDISALTERGAVAWAGVDAQGLREGAASAGSEPVAYAIFAENGQIRLWSVEAQHVKRIAAEKGLELVKLYPHPSPPEGMVGGWVASKDQMPPPGVRVFWGDIDSHRVGYDSWAGDDYRWTPSHWMHIPEFPAPPTSSADSRKGD